MHTRTLVVTSGARLHRHFWLRHCEGERGLGWQKVSNTSNEMYETSVPRFEADKKLERREARSTWNPRRAVPKQVGGDKGSVATSSHGAGVKLGVADGEAPSVPRRTGLKVGE